MYTPPAFALDSPAEVLAVLRQLSFGHLVTHHDTDGSAPALAATALPFVIDDGLSHVRAHFARANRHWRGIDGHPALLIVPGVDAYISPRWYPSKAEHGEVVPTWNYEVVHLHGTIEIHDDLDWKRQLVNDLTNHNENALHDPEQVEPWLLSDAPDGFIDGQLKAIVGVELNITSIEAKRKLSQNRSPADRVGATQGLARSDRHREIGTAELMESDLLP